MDKCECPRCGETHNISDFPSSIYNTETEIFDIDTYRQCMTCNKIWRHSNV